METGSRPPIGAPAADRAARHAALGDPVRLALVDELVVSDCSPSELGARLGVPSNLLAHHLAVLERAGLVRRARSGGDRRRRYVHLRRSALADLVPAPRPVPAGRVLFVGTGATARAPLAAALWRVRTGRAAECAGTAPGPAVHPGAIDAARRHGLVLEPGRPRPLDAAEPATAGLVVTVCDAAHERLGERTGYWHWSIPDPVPGVAPESFDATVAELAARIAMITGSVARDLVPWPAEVDRTDDGRHGADADERSGRAWPG